MLGESDLPAALATGALVVEDAAAADERALFHLMNLAREDDAFLLMHRADGAVGLAGRIADLASRLRAVPVVTLQAPDDALLRGVIVKFCADRQLDLDESVVSYL